MAKPDETKRIPLPLGLTPVVDYELEVLNSLLVTPMGRQELIDEIGQRLGKKSVRFEVGIAISQQRRHEHIRVEDGVFSLTKPGRYFIEKTNAEAAKRELMQKRKKR